MRFFDIDSRDFADVSREFFSYADELMRMGTELSAIGGSLEGMTGMGDICSAIAMEAENVRQIAYNVEGYGYMARSIADEYGDTEQGLTRIAENMNEQEG